MSGTHDDWLENSLRKIREEKAAAQEKLEEENHRLYTENLLPKKQLEDLSEKMAVFEKQIAAIKKMPDSQTR